MPESDRSQREVPERVLMPLLQRITSSALDEDYQHVAASRAAGAQPPAAARRRRRGWILVTVVAGMLLAIGITQTSQSADADQASRATVIDRVKTAREELDGLQSRIAEQSAELSEAQREDAKVADDVGGAEGRVVALQVRTGFGPATGPGIEALVNDSPTAGEQEAVRDEDLALLVNALWSAGAEAIAINGQRLTMLSYIQNSGPAIHVNSQPLLAPYRIQAIGDPRTLQADFAESSSGRRFNDLVHVLGFEFDMHNETRLSLPGARLRSLRQARTESIDTARANQGKPRSEGVG